MSRKRKSSKAFLLFFGFIAGATFFSYTWFHREIAPTAPGDPFYFRLNHSERIGEALKRLETQNVVRDESAIRIYAWFKRYPNNVPSGTYQVRPGASADEILKSLFSPILKNFRFPETNWARRNANLLQRAEITSAKDYLSAVEDPSEFQSDVSFPLKVRNLEGYLYPDTYELAPMTDAKSIVSRQLRTFQRKVVDKLGPQSASDDVICKASLVELETGTDPDRKMIAGVIDNRLKKGMPLQIDAGIEYALPHWRRLYFKDYKDVKSPFNLYLHKGLPPTPICSPSLKSIEAVLQPAHHDYLYYVALPDGRSLFAKTPAEHAHNIRLRKLALAARAKEKLQMTNFLAPSKDSKPAAKGTH